MKDTKKRYIHVNYYWLKGSKNEQKKKKKSSRFAETAHRPMLGQDTNL